jgi:hypothetical protein
VRTVDEWHSNDWRASESARRRVDLVTRVTHDGETLTPSTGAVRGVIEEEPCEQIAKFVAAVGEYQAFDVDTEMLRELN